MAPKFGTSGLRGLVVDLTPACVQAYVGAFAAACPTGAGLFIGHDLRPSSPDLAGFVAAAAQAAGLDVTLCGAVPTPALALAAIDAGASAIMVTGSHIPADRNGLKFYTPAGEITKDDEQNILAALGTSPPHVPAGNITTRADVIAAYHDRYRSAFRGSLKDKRIGLFAHSAVGRDELSDLLKDLGADVVELGRSDVFVPVDTEAVADQLCQQLRIWAQDYGLDAIVSTDADGDRPLMADGQGIVVMGDVLGQIAARGLGATHVVTPVSSNSGVEMGGHFQSVSRTKIGSPYVLAGMAATAGKVVGYEANGGFIVGFAAAGPRGPIPALMTRDAMLPLLMVLHMAGQGEVAALVAQEPACVTASDRLQEIDTQRAQEILTRLAEDDDARQAFIAKFGAGHAGTDQTDGLRLTLSDGHVVHLRLSGNAPELRVYAQAETRHSADKILQTGLAEMQRLIATQSCNSAL